MQVTDGDGLVVYEAQHTNRIVTSGRSLVAQLFAGIAGACRRARSRTWRLGQMRPRPRMLMAPCAPSVCHGARSAASMIQKSAKERAPARSNACASRLTAVFDFGDANGTEPLREAGIFTAENGGMMYNRVGV